MEEEEKGLRVEEMEMRAEQTRQGLRRTKQVLMDREKMQTQLQRQRRRWRAREAEIKVRRSMLARRTRGSEAGETRPDYRVYTTATDVLKINKECNASQGTANLERKKDHRCL